MSFRPAVLLASVLAATVLGAASLKPDVAAYPPSHYDMSDPNVHKTIWRDVTERLADFALVPPRYIQHPGEKYNGKYCVTNLDYCMSSTVAVTKEGRIWAGWFSGGDSARAFFCAARSDDYGKTWTDPVFIADPLDPYIPVPRFILIADLWVDPDGRLHFFHDQTMGSFNDYEGHLMAGSTTSDGRRGIWHAVCDDPDAETLVWSKPVRISDGHVLNKPVVAPDGTWLLTVGRGVHGGCPFNLSFDEVCEKVKGGWILASSDKGRTWSFRGGVRFTDSQWFENMAYLMRDGRLRMFARSLNKDHGIYEAYSSDLGWTWTDSVPAAAAGIDAPCSRFQVRKLKSGNVLFIKHGRTMPDLNHGARNRLYAFLSKDDGRTWEGGLRLEEEECSYPDSDETADGCIHVVYDHERGKAAELRYARFTEADVLAGKLVSPKSVLGVRVFKGFRKHMDQYWKEHGK